MFTNNLLKALPQQVTQSGMITMFGPLKSGKLTLRCVIDRGNPLWPFGERHTSPNQVSFMRRPSTMEQGNPLWLRQYLVKDRCNPLWSLKEKQGHSNLSLETMKQNQKCQWNQDHSWIWWMIKFEKDRKRISNVTETTKNILWYGECSWL